MGAVSSYYFVASSDSVRSDIACFMQSMNDWIPRLVFLTQQPCSLSASLCVCPAHFCVPWPRELGAEHPKLVPTRCSSSGWRYQPCPDSSRAQSAGAGWELPMISLSVSAANANISALCSTQIVLTQKSAALRGCFVTVFNEIMLLKGHWVSKALKSVWKWMGLGLRP